MSITHTLDLIRSNRQARDGIVTSILLILILMGWMAIEYGRINPFIIILTFPMFNAMFITSMTLFLIRAEHNSLTRLRTIPGAIEKSLSSAVILSMTIVYVLNAFFEIMTVLLSDFLAGILSPALSPVKFTPDPLTFLIFIGWSISLSTCFAFVGVWIFSQSNVGLARAGETLPRLEGYISSRLATILLLFGIAYVLAGLNVQTLIENSTIAVPSLVTGISLLFNAILASFLWHNARNSLRQKLQSYHQGEE